ncbi:MAG: hypothetical protein KA004_14220 [Verrucomicrobiales bacterium]|nr:hypothetical protein [Verrucomicrobiales bacterium]
MKPTALPFLMSVLLFASAANASRAATGGAPPGATASGPLVHDAAGYESRLQSYREAGGVILQRDGVSWGHLGQGSVAYANGDYDAALREFGQAVLGSDRSLQAQAHFNLANTLYQRAKKSAALAKDKIDADFMDNLIQRLKVCAEHYGESLSLVSSNKEAAENKATVEEFIKQLQQKQEQRQQQQRNQGEGDSQQKNSGQQGDGKQGQGDHSGKQQGKDQPKEGQPGETDKKEGEGKDQPKESEKGDNPDAEQKDGRSEEQKEKERQANETANQGPKGKVEAMEGDQQGDQSQKTKRQAAEGDEKRNEKTGFSRSEARRNLERFSDEVPVRQRIDRGGPDRPFKNW